MAQKPIHMVAADARGKAHGRQAVWQAVREQAEFGTFTEKNLQNRLPHVPETTIRDYLRALVAGGYVVKGEMVNRARTYTFIKDIGFEAPRLRKDGTELPPTAQQQMWLCMGILKSFTVEGLANSATTDEVPVTFEAARHYLMHLYKAGYLSCKSWPVVKNAQYQLINRTGGHAPVVQRTKVVFDPNLQKIMTHEVMEP